MMKDSDLFTTQHIYTIFKLASLRREWVLALSRPG